MNTLSKTVREKNNEYTVILYVNNLTRVLEKTLSYFSKKSLFIDSINSSCIPEKCIYTIVIVVRTNYELLATIIQLIKNDIDLIKINYYTEKELYYFEIAQYKISYYCFVNNEKVQNLVDKYQANIVEVNSNFILIEKKGFTKEIMAFYDEISSYNLLSFNRSGKITMMNNN